MPRNNRHKVFTLSAKCGEPVWYPEMMHYLVYGLEVGKQSTEKNPDGYQHFQGYVEFKKNYTLEEIWETCLPKGVKLAIRKGSKKQAIEYTKKDGKFVEYGEPEEQGHRTDLEAVREKIDSGATALDLAKDDFGTWCRNYRAFAVYADMINCNKKRDCSITYIYGPPGTGKSSLALAMFPKAYFKKPDTQWYQGYTNQQDLVIDEFRSTSLKFPDLFTLVSPMPYQMDIKGSGVWSSVNNVILISNYSPKEIVQDCDKVTQDAFYRRIKDYLYVPVVGLAVVLPSPTSLPPPPTTSVDVLDKVQTDFGIVEICKIYNGLALDDNVSDDVKSTM